MPFSKAFDDVYSLGIKAACDESGAVYCERVDKQIYQERWLDRIYNQIAKADIIIADMSTKNPNVFYEVGYAHALDKPTILLADKADEIPSDLKAYFHIIYENITRLKEQLGQRLDWYVENGVGDKQQSKNEFDPFINGIQIFSDRSAEQNGAYDGYSGLVVAVRNVSNRALSASDFYVALETSSLIVGRRQNGGGDLDSFALPNDRVQHAVEGISHLFPDQTLSQRIFFSSQSTNQNHSETVELKVFTHNGVVTFPFVLRFTRNSAAASMFLV